METSRNKLSANKPRDITQDDIKDYIKDALQEWFLMCSCIVVFMDLTIDKNELKFWISRFIIAWSLGLEVGDICDDDSQMKDLLAQCFPDKRHNTFVDNSDRGWQKKIFDKTVDHFYRRWLDTKRRVDDNYLLNV